MSDSFASPWTAPRPTPLSMGFPRQEYLSGLPFPFPGDLPNPGMERASPGTGEQEFQLVPTSVSVPTSSPGGSEAHHRLRTTATL